MKLKLYRNEWFVNAGLIGFLRIYEFANDSEEITVEDNYIEFDHKILEDFPNYYFDYLMNEYDKYEENKDKLEEYLSIIKNAENGQAKTALSNLKQLISNVRDKIKRDYEKKIVKNNENTDYNYQKEAKRLFDWRRKVDIEDIEEIENLVADFKELISNPQVNKRLTLNKVRSILSDEYFGQPSFLQRTASSDSLETQQQKVKTNYLLPVFDNLRFNRKLAYADSIDDLGEFIEVEFDRLERRKEKGIYNKSNLRKNVYRKFIKEIKRKFVNKDKTLEDVKDFLDNEVLNCSVWNHFRSNSQFSGKNVVDDDFTESVFIGLGISNRKAKNFLWNDRHSFPISNMLRLIMLCIPAGITNLTWEKKGFINLDTSISSLKKKNDILKENKEENNPFQKLIYDIVQEKEKKSSWILNNILFVEFNTDYSVKFNNQFNYFSISKKTAKFFKEYAVDILDKIKNNYFRTKTINLILNRDNTSSLLYQFGNKRCIVNNFRDLIDQELRRNISEKNDFGYYSHLINLLNYQFNLVLKERENVKEKSKFIWNIFFNGTRLGKAVNDNKVQGLAYKLLNSVNAGNKEQFMDSLLRTYMSQNMKMPAKMLNILQEEDADFETVAHSFIAGFISEKNGEENNKGDKDNE